MRILEGNKKKTVDFEELKSGDCFRDAEGDLMMKIDIDQDAVELSNGVVYGGLCGDQVTPVNAEVHIID